MTLTVYVNLKSSIIDKKNTKKITTVAEILINQLKICPDLHKL